MNIAFHTYALSERGTEIALYDYAHYAENLLGHQSYILYGANHPFNFDGAIAKFNARFVSRILAYTEFSMVDSFLRSNKIDIFYKICSGKPDSIVPKNCPMAVHAVFFPRPHGDRYAVVSEWLARRHSVEWVPHMVDLPQITGNLREELGIPQNAIVFGRYGGVETFDIPFVKQIILELIQKEPSIFFLFMNTQKFSPAFRNLIFLDGTTSIERKVRFIQSCDAMLHARFRGETFGLACAEFSSKNKPIITFRDSRERSHIEILGKLGLYYSNSAELRDLLLNFKPNTQFQWDCYSKLFSPKKVMEKFQSVFLT